MPWNSNDGGNNGWKPGSGGPWGQGSNGSGNNNGGNKGGGDNQQPDFEEMLKQTQDRFKKVLPNGGDNNEQDQNKFFFFIVIIGLIALWLYNSFYRVQTQELGVEIFLGKPKEELSTEGLNFHFWPIERVEIVDALAERSLSIGAETRLSRSSDGLMLSSDQNIVDVGFTVLYQVGDPRQYIFNTQNPDELVRLMAESAMREVVGQSIAEDVRTRERQRVADEVEVLTQQGLDKYGAGIIVRQVQLERANPPSEVADAFEEVQRAQQDQDRFQQEATLYKNEQLGKARGEEAKVIQEAEAYRDRVIAEATGESQRFLKILEEYQLAEDVTRTRLYLETMEEILGKSDKVILEQNSDGNGVLPYLPLPDIKKIR